MKEYLYQCRTSTAVPAWEYRMEFPSDKMALQYACSIAVSSFQYCPWFHALDVWRMPEQVRVGTVRLSVRVAETETTEMEAEVS